MRLELSSSGSQEIGEGGTASRRQQGNGKRQAWGRTLQLKNLGLLSMHREVDLGGYDGVREALGLPKSGLVAAVGISNLVGHVLTCL